MLEFVVSNDDLCRLGKTGEDGGQDGGLDGAPGYRWVRVLSPGSASFMDEGEGADHFGEALAVLQQTGDEVRGRADRRGGGEVDGQGRDRVGQESGACFNWPGTFRLREEAPMQPEIRIDLSTGRTRSGEYISWVEGSRAPEPVFWCGRGGDLHDPGTIEHRGRCWISVSNHSENDLRIT